MPAFTCRIDNMTPRFAIYSDTAAEAAETILKAVNRTAKHGDTVSVEVTPMEGEVVTFEVEAELYWKAYKI